MTATQAPHETRKERLERKISENMAVDAAKAILRGETGCPEGDEPYLAAGILAGHARRYGDSA
jgi:hypothetical protein